MSKALTRGISGTTSMTQSMIGTTASLASAAISASTTSVVKTTKLASVVTPSVFKSSDAELDEAALEAKEQERRLSARKDGMAAHKFIVGGTKRGWLVLLADTEELEGSQCLYCVAAPGELYTFVDDEVIPSFYTRCCCHPH